ncbi:sugar transferase [Arsukibacterium sp.]|uniref:sugar transferase n=1 Tax=Arsukibacterium sp. TaxID=1977258 RepID=UPI001BD639C4|nr:sugar transferase [Arsukibacterium sp.]
MLRVLDIVLSLAGILLLWPLLLVLLILGWFDTKSPVFCQQRVGRYQQPFILIKLRTMHVNTASVATHLASGASVTRLGGFLRKTKLDELPQLWNVLVGEMSLVGPRPCLYSQTELIAARQQLGVLNVRPGITGLAQIQGIDMSTPQLLAQTDATMLNTLTVKNYCKYLLMTVMGKGKGDKINYH